MTKIGLARRSFSGGGNAVFVLPKAICCPIQGLLPFGKRFLYCRQLITICDKLLL